MLDTKPPRDHACAHRIYTHISPDGDGRNDVVPRPLPLNEPAHGILLVDGRQVVLTRFQRLQGVLTWNGKIDGRVARRRATTCSAIAAQDAAGNRAKPFPFAVVKIRYVAARPDARARRSPARASRSSCSPTRRR